MYKQVQTPWESTEGQDDTEREISTQTAKQQFSFQTDLLTRGERLTRKGASLRLSDICHNPEIDTKVMRSVKINKMRNYHYLCAQNKRRVLKKKFCLDWAAALTPQMLAHRCSNTSTYKTAFEDGELPTPFTI